MMWSKLGWCVCFNTPSVVVTRTDRVSIGAVCTRVCIRVCVCYALQIDRRMRVDLLVLACTRPGGIERQSARCGVVSGPMITSRGVCRHCAARTVGCRDLSGRPEVDLFAHPMCRHAACAECWVDARLAKSTLSQVGPGCVGREAGGGYSRAVACSGRCAVKLVYVHWRRNADSVVRCVHGVGRSYPRTLCQWTDDESSKAGVWQPC